MLPAKALLVAAAFAPALLAAADAAPRRLGAPQVMKLDWGVDAVRSADIDGDGRTDLAALNNDTGRIELLFRLKPGEKPAPRRTLREDRWNPPVDDAPFRRLSVSGSPDMGALALADIDGDGRIDLAYTSSRDALTVLFQDKSGEFSRRRVFNRYETAPGDKTLAAADLDGDGKRELVMLSKAGLLVFKNFSGAGALPEPTVYRTGADSPYALNVADLNGDKLPDLAYIARGERPELRVRFALKDGGFGPERAFRTEYASVDLENPIPAGKGETGFAGVNMRRRALEIFSIRKDDTAFKDAEAVSPALYSPSASIKSPALVTLAGEGELLVADSRGAAIQVFRRDASGDFGEPVTFPAPANLTAIAAANFAGDTTVFTLGEKDGALGFATFDDKGRLGFPVEVKVEGTPVALTSGSRPSGSSYYVAYVITKDDKKARLITLCRKLKATAVETLDSVEIDAAARDAEGLIFGDIAGRPVLIVPCGSKPALLLAAKQNDKGGLTYETVAKDSALRKGMLSGVSTGDIGFGDIDGDGKNELLVSATGFVRALTLNDKGDLAVKDQFNTRRPGDKPRCPAVVKLDGDKPGLLFYNETDKGLEWLAPDDKGVFRHRRTVETGALDAQAIVATDVAGRLLYAGKDRIAEVDTRVAGLRAVTLDRYETDLPGTVHALVETGRFTGGASPDAVLIDPRNHRLELVSPRDDSGWRSAMHFGLYDENPFYRGRRNAGFEPHDTLATDLDGDGFPELVLLMHDRLLVYPSEPAK